MRRWGAGMFVDGLNSARGRAINPFFDAMGSIDVVDRGLGFARLRRRRSRAARYIVTEALQ